MGFLLLGIDSLIACIAIGALVDRRSRLWLAGLFGVADGVAFLIGAGLGWQLSGGLTEGLEIGLLVAMALYLLVVAGGTRRVTALWPVWVVPFALTLDNLAYGVAGEHAAGSVVAQRRGTGAVEFPARPHRAPRGGRRAPADGASRSRQPGRRRRSAPRGRRACPGWLTEAQAVELAAALRRAASSTSMRTP